MELTYVITLIDMKQLKNIALFMAVVIAAFALVITCLSSFNYAYEHQSGFHAVCGIITLVAGGYAVYKASRATMEPFMHDENK